MIKETLDRWVEKIYPSKEEFEKLLKSGRKLTIYHGIDPTAPHLHLGHSTNFFLLKQLQKLGQKIILLIGDFTAQIGDPTEKSTTRKALTRKEVLKNCRTYQKQAGQILSFKSLKNPVELKFNSQWLSKLIPEEIIKLAANFTHSQVIKRDMFQQRIKKGKEIYLHEFLYPLLQAYDSVALNADVELGGTDQIFNMLRGRDLMKIYRNKEKFIIATPLLINPKTGRKLMSKSEGNFIALDDQPNVMFGKTMALPDEIILPCLRLCTEMPLEKTEEIEKSLRLRKINPRKAKIILAREVVSIYHGKKAAEKAEKEFNRIFREKKLPTRIPEVQIREKTLNILDLLVKTKLASSKSQAKRLIFQKGVKIDGKIQRDWREVIQIKKGLLIQVGKRKFKKIISA